MVIPLVSTPNEILKGLSSYLYRLLVTCVHLPVLEVVFTHHSIGLPRCHDD